MSRTSLRRTASALAATALIAGGLAVGAGPAAAVGSSDLGSSSEGAAAPVEQKPTSATAETSNLRITKSVVGDGTVIPGGQVTYRTTVSVPSGLDRGITKISDIHPAGFKYVDGSAKLTAWYLVGGTQTSSVTPTVADDENRVTAANLPLGWIASSAGASVTLEVTYEVPADATPGTALDSGASFDVLTFASTQKFDPMGVWVTVRNPNLGEAVGSAELGLGSSDGEDPAAFVTGLLGNGS
ncbi:hypothetical protein [Rhodococcus sp. NPDC003348]